DVGKAVGLESEEFLRQRLAEHEYQRREDQDVQEENPRVGIAVPRQDLGDGDRREIGEDVVPDEDGSEQPLGTFDLSPEDARGGVGGGGRRAGAAPLPALGTNHEADPVECVGAGFHAAAQPRAGEAEEAEKEPGDVLGLAHEASPTSALVAGAGCPFPAPSDTSTRSTLRPRIAAISRRTFPMVT